MYKIRFKQMLGNLNEKTKFLIEKAIRVAQFIWLANQSDCSAFPYQILRKSGYVLDL